MPQREAHAQTAAEAPSALAPRGAGRRATPQGVREHRLRRGTALVVAMAIIGTLFATSSSLSVPRRASAAVPHDPPPLGVYAGWQQGAAINKLGSYIGQQPHYAMDFLDGTSWSELVASAARDPLGWQQFGYQMVWGVEMLPDNFYPGTAPCNAQAASDFNSEQSGACGLSEGAAGDFNATFAQVATNLVAAGQGDAVIRLGWEFNGGWFAWSAGGVQHQFIAYYRQIVTAMRSVPGEHFLFEWNPALGDLWVGDLAGYFPGNHFVDIVAADVYDLSWGSYPGPAAEFSTLERERFGLDWLAAFAAEHDKPIALPEWGLGWGVSAPGSAPLSAPGQETCGGDDPAFVDAMAAWIATHKVIEATFWDYQDLPGGGAAQDVLVGAYNPLTTAALRRDFGPGQPAAGPAGGAAPGANAPPTAPVLANPPSATLTAARPGRVALDAAGYPAPRIKVSGPLPPGLRLGPHHGALVGTPAPGSGGVYVVKVTAVNGVTPRTSQRVDLHVDQAPAFTSSPTVSCVAGAWCSLTVSVTAEPQLSSFVEHGALPAGLTWSADDWSGRATLSGWVDPAAAGSYPLDLEAANPLGASSQQLAVTVSDP